MAKFAFIVLVVLSTNVFASIEGQYKGITEGTDCVLELDGSNSSVVAKDITCMMDKVKVKGNKIKMDGFNEIEYCKVTVELDAEGNPTEYKLKVKNLLDLFYHTAAICKDLQKIK